MASTPQGVVGGVTTGGGRGMEERAAPPPLPMHAWWPEGGLEGRSCRAEEANRSENR